MPALIDSSLVNAYANILAQRAQTRDRLMGNLITGAVSFGGAVAKRAGDVKKTQAALDTKSEEALDQTKQLVDQLAEVRALKAKTSSQDTPYASAELDAAERQIKGQLKDIGTYSAKLGEIGSTKQEWVPSDKLELRLNAQGQPVRDEDAGRYSEKITKPVRFGNVYDVKIPAAPAARKDYMVEGLTKDIDFTNKAKAQAEARAAQTLQARIASGAKAADAQRDYDLELKKIGQNYAIDMAKLEDQRRDREDKKNDNTKQPRIAGSETGKLSTTIIGLQGMSKSLRLAHENKSQFGFGKGNVNLVLEKAKGGGPLTNYQQTMKQNATVVGRVISEGNPQEADIARQFEAVGDVDKDIETISYGHKMAFEMMYAKAMMDIQMLPDGPQKQTLMSEMDKAKQEFDREYAAASGVPVQSTAPRQQIKARVVE